MAKKACLTSSEATWPDIILANQAFLRTNKSCSVLLCKRLVRKAGKYERMAIFLRMHVAWFAERLRRTCYIEVVDPEKLGI